jgi:glutamate-1-semialdehyde 2,1-aminomutase
VRKSKALFAASKKVIVGGVDSPVRAFRSVGGDPVFVKSARGSHLTDADGKDYVDYVLSWGPMILGHAHPAAVRAAEKALRKGSSYGAPTEEELRLATAVREALPSMERLRFVSSGTEAVMSALRLARAYTKRELVVKFVGGYHGHVDSLLVAAGSGVATLGRADSAGVPAAWAKTTLCLPYNDIPAVQRAFREHGRRIAAVIVEPVAANMGVVAPEPPFLETLRELTKKNKALLIFDEVITGFRFFYGGAQTGMRITPDLTTLGKIVGGGFPVGCYGGRREIMELVAPLGPVYQAGTLSGNPVAMAAGLATLDALRREKPYARMAEMTRVLVTELRGMARFKGLPVQVNHVASMLTVFFSETPVRDFATAKTSDTKAYGRFFHALLDRGVYFPPAQFEAAMLSAAHTPADLERTLEAAARAFRRL